MSDQVLYLDTSALIKRYFPEQGSDQVDRYFHGSGALMTASLTYAETYATFSRLYREGLISTKKRASVGKSFEEDWQSLVIVDFDAEVRNAIPNLTRKFPLRGADAVHLSSVTFLASRGIELQFISADRKLLHAAEDAGFSIVNPKD